MAVTPDTGADQPNGQTNLSADGFTQIPGGPMSEEQALARINSMLDPEATTPGEDEQPEKPKPEPKQEAADEPDLFDESEREAQDEPADDEKTEEADSEEGSDEELPDTLEALAEALGMEAEDFASRIRGKIKVNGKVSEVSLAEALRGYQREQDYSRRREEIGEQRRQMEAQSQTFEQERKQQLEELGTLHQALTQRVNGITDDLLMRVYQEQGQEAYMQLDMQRKHDQALLEKVREQGKKLVEEHQQRLSDFRTEQQRRLAEVDPDFRDPDKAQAVQGEMMKYLKTKDFTDEELKSWFDGPFDHRHIQVIRDAAKYRVLMEKSKSVGGSKPKPKPKLKKAGSAEDHTPPTKLTSLRQRFKQTRGHGRMAQQEAGVAMISEMLKKGE